MGTPRTETTPGRPVTPQKDGLSTRLAAWIFGGVIAIAVPAIMYQGRDQWFFLDDWDFLSSRTAGDIHGLFVPHAQHWVTLPILAYRLIWWMFGLNHYWPYQILLVALHLGAAVLLRIVMRRAGVHPWIATTAASLFALYGAGRADIVYSFQITFTGALVFGLGQLLFADHDGPLDRRDVAGIVCGLLALMCSGVGITMVFAVGVATLLRRGWKIALAHTAPLAGVFVLWLLAFGRDAYSTTKATPSQFIDFVREAFVAAFGGLGQVAGISILLGLMLVVGAVVMWRRETWTQIRQSAAATIGLVAAAAFFVSTTAYGRATDASGNFGAADASRYVHLVSAMVLPALALAATAIAARWRYFLPVGIALFLIGLPGNIDALHASGLNRFSLGDPDLTLTMARLPEARTVPPSSRPTPSPGADFPIGWLVDSLDAGKVPEPPASGPRVRAEAQALVSLSQTSVVSATDCSAIAPTKVIHVEQGNQIAFDSRTVTVHNIVNGRALSSDVYKRFLGPRLTVVAGPLDLRIQPDPATGNISLCK